MTDFRTEALLQRAANSIRYPATPDLAGAVASAIEGRTSARRRVSLSPVLIALLLLAAGFVVLLAVQPARESVARFFGVEGSRVERLPAGESVTSFPAPVGLIAVATPLPISEIGGSFPFEPAYPSGFGLPRAAYAVRYNAERVLVLEYERFDLWEVGPQSAGFFEKGVPTGVVLRETTIRGNSAYWIAEGSHIVRFVDREGREARGSVRTVERNTLIWRTDRLFYRLETDLPFEEAVRVAESLP
jgi:hypothetical protein